MNSEIQSHGSYKPSKGHSLPALSTVVNYDLELGKQSHARFPSSDSLIDPKFSFSENSNSMLRLEVRSPTAKKSSNNPIQRFVQFYKNRQARSPDLKAILQFDIDGLPFPQRLSSNRLRIESLETENKELNA